MKLLKNQADYVYSKKLYIIAFLIFFIPRLISLGSDISNYDASYWYPRLDSFAKNVVEADYRDTYQKYHPGVTVLWLSGMPKYAFEQLVELKYGYNPRFMPIHFTKLNFVTIFPLVFVISLLGTISFFFIKNLSNTKLALIFSLMLSLEPFFLGVSKYLHLSVLQSMFIFAGILSIYYYYNHIKAQKYFYLSAVLLGLGFLTKIDTIIALVFVNGLIALKTYKDKKTFVRELFIYNLTTLFTFILLFPSLWVEPLSILRKIYYEGILDTALTDDGDLPMLGVSQLFYSEILFLRSLPTTIILFITGIVLTLRDILKNKKLNPVVYYSLLFTFFNLIILSIPSKTIDRYIFNFYPAFMLTAAYPLYFFLKDFKFNLSQTSLLKSFLIILLAGFYALTLYRYYPVYSYYYTELIGAQPGLYKLGFPIKNRGEYYAQAAQYINKNDPDAVNKIVVLTNREQIRTFQPFFYGTTFTTPKLMPNGRNTDYIISRPKYDHLVPKDFCTLEKDFGPGEPITYAAVKLYKCQGVTNEYKDFRN